MMMNSRYLCVAPWKLQWGGRVYTLFTVFPLSAVMIIIIIIIIITMEKNRNKNRYFDYNPARVVYTYTRVENLLAPGRCRFVLGRRVEGTYTYIYIIRMYLR